MVNIISEHLWVHFDPILHSYTLHQLSQLPVDCLGYTAWETYSVLSSCLSSNQSICTIQKFISITLAEGLTLYFRFALYKKHQKCGEKVQAKGSLLEKHAKILDHLLLLGNSQNKNLGSPQSSTKEKNKKGEIKESRTILRYPEDGIGSLNTTLGKGLDS